LLIHQLQSKLEKRLQENSLRRLTVTPGLIDFSSNDYLGLAHSEELYQLIKQKTDSLPHLNGATGSRLLTGNTEYTHNVEHLLAKIFKSEAALIFNSGYAANQGVISCIAQREDTIFYDELAHACIRDGARLSFANRHAFRHNDLNDLESKLKKTSGNIFIAVESVYSMDGDLCPLAELVVLSEKYNATIILDEAHSTGVMGNNGSGLAVSLGLEDRIPIRIYTFGKAMGVHGACVAGTKILIDYLINFARTFIFTTAMPFHSIASIECAFNFLNRHISIQNNLTGNIHFFKKQINKSKIKYLSSNTQIQGVVIPDNYLVKKISVQLKETGFDARPILSPTVTKGTERLRICLHTFNTQDQITNLTETISKILS
jgi:8-amino-7-oxononanoate synthase